MIYTQLYFWVFKYDTDKTNKNTNKFSGSHITAACQIFQIVFRKRDLQDLTQPRKLNKLNNKMLGMELINSYLRSNHDPKPLVYD